MATNPQSARTQKKKKATGARAKQAALKKEAAAIVEAEFAPSTAYAYNEVSVDNLDAESDEPTLTPTVKLRPPRGEVLYNEKVPIKVGVTEVGLRVIENLAALGRQLQTIASVLGISWGRFEDIRKIDDRVNAALELGEARYKDRLTDALTHMAERGNVAAAIWVEKTRFGYRDNAPVQSNETHVHLHLSDSVSPADYAASLAKRHEEEHAKAMDQEGVRELFDLAQAVEPKALPESTIPDAEFTDPAAAAKSMIEQLLQPKEEPKTRSELMPKPVEEKPQRGSSVGDVLR